jgi:hypothetical protein
VTASPGPENACGDCKSASSFRVLVGRENAFETMRTLAEAMRNVVQAMKVDAIIVLLQAVEGFMSFTLCRLLTVQAVNVLVEPLDCFRGHENACRGRELLC